MSEKSFNPVTRSRLLESAGEAFAENGYKETTVRDICKGAGANVAAVNYHFRDKEHLYEEILKYVMKCSHVKFPLDGRLPADAPPQTRLKIFILNFLRQRFDKDRPAWHGRLLMREMMYPTGALRKIIPKEIKENRSLMNSIVSDFLDKKSDMEIVDFCTASIIGQCIAHFHGKHPGFSEKKHDEPSSEQVERIADHIYEFSLAGLNRIKQKLDGGISSLH